MFLKTCFRKWILLFKYLNFQSESVLGIYTSYLQCLFKLRLKAVFKLCEGLLKCYLWLLPLPCLCQKVILVLWWDGWMSCHSHFCLQKQDCIEDGHAPISSSIKGKFWQLNVKQYLYLALTHSQRLDCTAGTKELLLVLALLLCKWPFSAGMGSGQQFVPWWVFGSFP